MVKNWQIDVKGKIGKKGQVGEFGQKVKRGWVSQVSDIGQMGKK